MAVTEREEVSDLVILLDQIKPLNYRWVVLGERRGEREGERAERWAERGQGLYIIHKHEHSNNYVHATEMF